MSIEKTEGALSAPDELDADTANETTESDSEHTDQENDEAEAGKSEAEGETDEGDEAEQADAAKTEETKAEDKADEGDEEPETKETKQQRKRRLRREREQRLEAELAQERKRLEALQKRIDALTDIDPNASENYDEAIAQNTVNKTLRAQGQAELEDAKAKAQEIESEAQTARLEAWNEKVSELAHIKDFKDRVLNDPEVPFTPEIVATVVELDRGPEVAYHLATHQEELRRLHRLSPVRLGVELGRIEASLSLPKPKLKSTAPAPLKTLKSSNTESEPDLESAEYEQFKELRGLA